MEEDYTSSSDPDVDHEDDGSPRAQRHLLRGRRGVSVDLHNFHRDIVSHHATTRIPTPSYIPSAENTPEASPTSSASSLSPAHQTPPTEQGSPSRNNSISRVQSNADTDQRDRRLTVLGMSGLSVPSTQASRNRVSRVLGDFRRALGSDLNSSSSRSTPPQTATSALTSLAVSPSLRSPSNGIPSRPSTSRSSRSPVNSDDGTRGRKRRNRFSLSAISDAILDSVRSHSPLPSKRGAEGPHIGLDAYGGEKTGETMRGRSTDKGKRMSRDLSHALIKVSEVFGLEPEEGKEPRDGWKEFKKGVILFILLNIQSLTVAWLLGTYRYPISFAIPADSPPSLDSMFGSIVWTLTATVHRPGRFTPRMETVRTINVVAAPSDDATEDVESVTVNKTWEDQMVYRLSIVGRAFPIGSKVPVHLIFLPLAKIKIHRVTVAVDGALLQFLITRHPF